MQHLRYLRPLYRRHLFDLLGAGANGHEDADIEDDHAGGGDVEVEDGSDNLERHVGSKLCLADLVLS